MHSFIMLTFTVTSEIMNASMGIVKLFVARNRLAILQMVDNDLPHLSPPCLLWLSLIYSEAKVQRPLLKHFNFCVPVTQAFTATELIKLVLDVNGPLVENPEVLIDIIDDIDMNRESRMKAWRYLEKSTLQPSEILERTIVNLHRLQGKAELWLRLPPPDRDFFRLIASLNSWHALDVAFDTIRETLLDEKIVTLMLREPEATKSKTRAIRANQARRLKNFDSILIQRRWILNPAVRYGRAVIEKFGREKLRKHLDWHVALLKLELEGLSDLLESPKQNAIKPRKLESIVKSITIARELELDVNAEVVQKLRETLRKPAALALFSSGELEPLITVINPIE
jgi:hypothetical protein